MARWRLMNSHYLSVPGTEWEYSETDRTTGKRGRKVFEVPAFLNPNDRADQNYPELGEIIVCYEGKGERKDIVFVGEPTPDMEPVDAEAEEISASLASKWKHPIETLPSHGDYSASLLTAFERQIAAVLKSVPGAAPVNVGGVDPAEFKQMQEQLAALMARNAELEGKAGEPAKRRA